MIEQLSWDSQFFALKIGKATTDYLTEILLSEILEAKQREHYDLVYLFCKNLSDIAEEKLTKLNVVLADEKTTFKKNIKHKPNQETTPFNDYKGKLTDELLQLALSSGHLSRFKKDPRLNDKYNELYKLWIEKSLSGELANVVITTQSSDRISGFVTAKAANGIGHIGLIAVDERERGKGLGTQLLNQLDNWHTHNNVTTCYVVTQLANTAACKLYERNGYTIDSIEKIYHL